VYAGIVYACDGNVSVYAEIVSACDGNVSVCVGIISAFAGSVSACDCFLTSTGGYFDRLSNRLSKYSATACQNAQLPKIKPFKTIRLIRYLIFSLGWLWFCILYKHRRITPDVFSLKNT